MVSRYKRHLSLFLVTVLVMSWFLVPEAIKPWVPIAKAQTSSLEVAPANLKLKEGYQFTYKNDSSRPATSITFEWIRPTGALAETPGFNAIKYEIQYMPSQAAPRGMTSDLCKTTFTPWTTLTKVDDSGLGSSRTIQKIVDDARTTVGSIDAYFRIVATDMYRLRSGSDVTKLDPPVALTCGQTPLNKLVGACPTNQVRVVFSSSPEGATVLVNGKTLDEFASQPKTKTTTSICYARNTGSGVNGSIEFKLTGKDSKLATIDFTKDVRVYADFNAAGDQATISTDLGTGSEAGGVVGSGVIAAKNFFANITNGIKTTIGSGGDILLKDDSTDTTGDTNDDDIPDPVKPPTIFMARSKLKGMESDTKDLKWKLTSTIRSPETKSLDKWFANNNYFLFEMVELTEIQTKALKDAGVETAKTYLVIDISGNLVILVGEKSAIFSSGKSVLDEFKAMGSFNGNQNGTTTDSKNVGGKDFAINIEQYHDTITRRVYNDANAADANPLADDGCKPSPPIHYPMVNTSYEDTARFPGKIPVSTYRKCINRDPEGWLVKWGITDTRIDQVPKSDCEQAFGSKSSWFSFITDTFAKSLCFVMNAMISGATWMAGFSIEFLIKAIGLQIR